MVYKTKSFLKSVATKATTLSGVIAASCIALSAQSAQAINLSLPPSSFIVNQGVGNPAAAANIAIDDSAPNGGFGNRFSSTFLLLGANINDTSILTDSLNDNNSRAVSPLFELTSSDVSQNLVLTYDWAFNGNSSGIAPDQDNFSISIRNVSLGVLSSFIVQQAGAGYGGANAAQSTILGGTLAAGTGYQIVITVNENNDGLDRSSAAGFNNISLNTPSVTPPTTVPFGFSTNASLVVFGGVFYGFNKLRKRAVANKFQA